MVWRSVVPGIEDGIEDDDTKFCIGAEGVGGIAAEFLVKCGRDGCCADGGPRRYGFGVILEERRGELAVVAIGGVVVAGYKEKGNVGSCRDVSEVGQCFAGISHGADDGVCDCVAGQVAEVDHEAGLFRSEHAIDLLLGGVPGVGAGVAGGGWDSGLFF